ncbi:MAG: NAD(P)/FAD-dependent oxidoreductase [bacterium]|nr:NAD(P)/FAD-dependent oxidoreductase [bacterium]
MSPPVDLLVVGAGPAGSALALLAAEAGARVVLLDRARFPRSKVCGEFVSAEGCSVLQRLDLLDELLAAGAQWMSSCRISEPGGRAIEAPLPRLAGAGREALGISRATLDLALVERAASRGVDVRQQHEVVAPLVADDKADGRVEGVRVRRTGGAHETGEVRARLVVAADGRRSTLARRLAVPGGDPRRTDPRSWFGLRTHLVPRAAHPRQVELHVFDGGYAGTSPVEGGRINLCMLLRVATLRACEGSADRVLRERVLANPAAAARFGGAEIAGSWDSVGPLRFAARRPTSHGALFVGDAAGTVDPFCGEGMSNALQGAEVALPHVRAMLEAGGPSASGCASYARDWRRAFAGATLRARALSSCFERPRVARLAVRALGGGARALTPRLVAWSRTGRRARADG